jgi:hypothetical protein
MLLDCSALRAFGPAAGCFLYMVKGVYYDSEPNGTVWKKPNTTAGATVPGSRKKHLSHRVDGKTAAGS